MAQEARELGPEVKSGPLKAFEIGLRLGVTDAISLGMPTQALQSQRHFRTICHGAKGSLHFIMVFLIRFLYQDTNVRML